MLALGDIADKIRRHLTGQLASVIEVGKLLNEVKVVLPHGEFQDWAKSEFGWSKATTANYMRVSNFAASLGKSKSDFTFAELPIDTTAAIQMASKSFPEPARKELLKMAESGIRVSDSIAKETKKKHKPKKDPNEGKKRCPTCNEFYHPDDFGAGLYCLECQDKELTESRSAMEPQEPGSGTKSPFADVRVMHKAVEDMKPELRDVFVSDLLEKYGMEAEPTTAPNEELQTPLQQIKVIWDSCTTAQRREIKRAMEGWQVSNSKDDPIMWQNAFDAFWQRVHSKKGKATAEAAFKRAVNRKADKDDMPRRDSAAKIIEAMMVFADSPEANPDDRTAIHPATWLNQGRYDDDPATWHSKNGTAKKKENFYS